MELDLAISYQCHVSLPLFTSIHPFFSVVSATYRAMPGRSTEHWAGTDQRPPVGRSSPEPASCRSLSPGISAGCPIGKHTRRDISLTVRTLGDDTKVVKIKTFKYCWKKSLCYKNLTFTWIPKTNLALITWTHSFRLFVCVVLSVCCWVLLKIWL